MASSNVINQWNEQWRSSPLYQQGLQAVGEPTNGPITLNDGQRKQLQQWLMQQGVQFPKGVEIDPAGNMNEDEGFGKQLKKWGPIAAGAAMTAFGIPGLTPGLFGGIGTGASTAATTAASGAGNSIFGGANSAGLFGSGATGANLGGLGATNIASGLFGGAGGAGVAGGIGGFLGGLGKQLGGDLAQRFLGAAGSGIGGASQAAANNRGVALDAELQAALLRQRQQEAYQDQLLARSRDDRESLSDAYGKSVAANRTLSSTGYKPAMISTVPGQAPSALPNFGTGFAAPNDAQRADATALRSQVQPRLEQGSQLPALQAPSLYQNDPRYMNPGAGERIGNWLGPILGGLGAQRNPMVAPQQPQQQSTDPSRRQQ